MSKPSAFSTLVQQARIEDSLGYLVVYKRSFHHGGDPDDPYQLTNISDFYNDRGSRRSLDVGV